MPGKCDLPLHGLTVVAETDGPILYIGRFDFEDDERIVLKDVQIRRLEAEESKDAILAEAAAIGVWKTDDRVEVPRDQVTSLRLLSEIADPAS